MAMNATPNHSAAELDQSCFAENSRMSILGSLFKSRNLEVELSPGIDSSLDCSFGNCNTSGDENLPEFYRLSENLEYGGAFRTISSQTKDTGPFPNAIDESFIESRTDCSVDINLPLLEGSCSDAPTISKHCVLGSYRKDTDITSSVFSTIAHLAVFFAVAFSINIGSIGQYGNSSERIFVKLIDPSSMAVQQNRPASIDSAASCPSIAKRSKKDQGQGKEEILKNTQKTARDMEKGADPGCNGPSDKVTTNERDIKLLERDISSAKKTDQKDDVNFESPSMQDSVASVPSVASAEQRSAAPQGEEADKFKKMVLSAIYRAAYYPRAALRQKEAGEAFVSFVVVGAGSIESVAVVKKSGSEILDQAALKIIEKASTHFPAIPETLGHKRINYVVPITFKKRS
jgi:TonB family protein